MLAGAFQDVAATRIQASYRGYKTRSKARKDRGCELQVASDDGDAMNQVRV